MDELKWTIEQNERAIADQMKKINQDMTNLNTMVESKQWHGYDSMVWVDGHAAEDMAKLSALLMRQRTLVEALRIMEK